MCRCSALRRSALIAQVVEPADQLIPAKHHCWLLWIKPPRHGMNHHQQAAIGCHVVVVLGEMLVPLIIHDVRDADRRVHAEVDCRLPPVVGDAVRPERPTIRAVIEPPVMIEVWAETARWQAGRLLAA